MNVSKFKITGQGVLLVVIALIPILFVPLSFLSLEPLKIFIILIAGVFCTIAALLHKIKQDSFLVTKNAFFLSMFGVILSTLLSTLFSNNIVVSLFGRQISVASFLGLLSLFALSYVISLFFEDIKEKTRLFLALYVSGVFVVFLQFLSIVVPFFPTFNYFVNNTVNTIGRWSDFGIYSLFVALSSVLVLQFLKYSKFYRVIGWIGFVLGILMVILVNSLTVLILGAFFSLIYIVLNAVLQHESEVKNRVSYEALIILIISVIFILIRGNTGVLTNSVFNIQPSGEVKPLLVSTFQATKNMVQKQPVSEGILGIGVDRFDTAWLMYRPLNTNLSQYWDSDFRYGYSALSSVGVTQGILGILAWFIFFAVSVYFSFKLLFVTERSKNDLFMYMYSTLGFMFFFVTMIVYTPPTVLVALFFVYMGFFISNLKHAELIRFKEVAINQNPRVSFVYILLLVLLLIAFIYVGYIHISQYVSRVAFERAVVGFSVDNDLEKAETKIRNAYFIYNSDIYTRALTEIGLLKINKIIGNKELTQEQAISQFKTALENTIGYAQSSVVYDAQSYTNRMSLLSVYKNLIPLGVADAKDEALKIIDSTLQLTPDNPTLYLEQARIRALAKEFDPAIESIKKAIELKSNYIDAVFLLSQIQVEKGEINQAIESIAVAIQVDKFNPNLYFQLGILYYSQEKFNDSIIVFEEALKYSPNFANAKYFLGLSYYKNNRTGDAIKVFENLQQQIPDNQEVALILSNLKAGLDPFNGAQPPVDSTPEQRDELPVEEETPVVEDKSE